MSIRGDAIKCWPEMTPELMAELAKSSWHLTKDAEGPLTCVACGYAIDDPMYVLKEGKTYHAVLCRQAFEARHAKARENHEQA